MSMRKTQGVYLADTARVMGQVKMGKDVNLWYGTTVRGDVAPISIGSGTNLQEGATVHCDEGGPNDIGENITIGHGAIVHGRSVGDGSLIGMGAVLLGGSVVGKNCLIAARALVTEGMAVPDNSVVMGIPGKVVRTVSEEQLKMMHANTAHYIELAKHHHEHPDDEITKPWGE
jgi:carbonic anhydrase/acetyltransferase-like protein (isoleucine patch superfamily)